ncbi:MAG: hypothetical protein MUO26_12750 [Methanotrichaceae archaeon]|nr:hypothetical protein [Methanotrichaceae archaeon]
MKLIWFITIILLLSGAAEAQLAPDRERFDIVLHPGEVEQKTLTLQNVGDSPIFKIMNTPIGGNAKDFIVLEMPEFKILPPQEKEKAKIFFVVPPETQIGNYGGFLYLIDAAPPSMPVLIEFNISIVDQESYGLSMTINEAKFASTFAEADDVAEFEILVKNLGRFREVASIDAPNSPEAWSLSLLDGEKDVSLPYNLPLEPGMSHPLKLNIETSNPGKKDQMDLVATSLGNRSKNSSVKAEVEFGKGVRAYDVKIDVPVRIAVNRTYQGALIIALDVSESIRIGVITPLKLMVIPLTQVADISPDKPGVANFTMLSTEPGDYIMIFKLIDSNGVPMPEEITTIKVVKPNGTAILTGDDFIYNAIASLASPDNQSLPSFSLTQGKLDGIDRQSLLSFSKVVIIGNQSIVSSEVEKSLQDLEIKRIDGNNLCELTWRFVADIWQNGTTEIIFSSPEQTDIFKAYQEAKIRNLPMVIFDSTMTNATTTIVNDLTKRKNKLNKAVVVGNIGENNLKTLEDMGISIEEAAR